MAGTPPRHCQGTQESLRGLDSYAKAESWCLTPENARGVQAGLVQGVSYYGQATHVCDTRRAEYHKVLQYLQEQGAETIPTSELFSQGYVAMRMPSVQDALRRHGCPEHLLQPYQAPLELLTRLQQGPAVLNTSGEAMSPDDLHRFRVQALGRQDREEASPDTAGEKEP